MEPPTTHQKYIHALDRAWEAMLEWLALHPVTTRNERYAGLYSVMREFVRYELYDEPQAALRQVIIGRIADMWKAIE